MISILATSISIVADATYKIIIEGFPVLTVGTTDKDRHFIPFGCVVSTGEAENDFKFLFDSLKEGLKMIDPSFIYSEPQTTQKEPQKKKPRQKRRTLLKIHGIPGQKGLLFGI